MADPTPHVTLLFEGVTIRTLRRSDEPWFVLVDVCVALDISNPATAAGRLNADERNSASIQTPGGPQDMTIINEMGLWSLVMTSRKPSAQRLKAWLASVAIPSLHAGRREGLVPAPQNQPMKAPAAGSVRIFDFEGFDVRITDQSGEPWWVLADVCRVLEIALPHRAADRLDDDEKAKVDMSAPGVTTATGAKINDLGVGSGNNDAWIINESGLYSLILTSRKPAAKRFKKWVTGTVLPSIRKTGGYGVLTHQPDLNDPVQLRALLLSYSEREQQTQKALADARTEASVATGALNRIAGTEGLLCLRDTAKVLNQKPKTFREWLITKRYAYRRPDSTRLLAYQTSIRSGLLVHKLHTFTKPDGTEGSSDQPMATRKGITRFARDLGVDVNWSAVSEENPHA